MEGKPNGDRLLLECFATPLHSLEGHVLQHSKEPGTLMSLRSDTDSSLSGYREHFL